MERILESVLRIIPVWIVGTNGPLFREIEIGLRDLLTIEFRGIYPRWQPIFEHLRLLGSGAVNIILAEADRDDADGFRWIESIREVAGASVVALLHNPTRQSVMSALRHRASGILTSPFSSQQISSAVLSVASGETVISSSLMDDLVEVAASLRRASDVEGLTKREIEILTLLVQGNSVKGIAEALSISYYTADTHLKNLRKKLNVKNSRALVSYALKSGLLPPDSD